jgi:hypothetical protein
MATPAQRRELAALMDYMIAHRGKVHYPPGDRRTETIHGIHTLGVLHARIERTQGLTIDCSQAVTLLCLVAGLDNPNGGNTDGYTGTLLAHLPHYRDARHANVGALVVFGPGTGHHVAMVRRPDPKHGNPLLFSHGQEADPRLIPLGLSAAYQPAPVTLLSIAGL